MRIPASLVGYRSFVATEHAVNLPDYPFSPKRFDRGNGLQLSYLDEGQGDAVVMVHGNPTWSYYYRKLVLALRGEYRCIVPDHIGMGLSDKPDDSRYHYTLDSRIDDLDRLLAHLDIGERVTLVVHDWGGLIGLNWALRNPQKVRRLIVLNTAGFTMPIRRVSPCPTARPCLGSSLSVATPVLVHC